VSNAGLVLKPSQQALHTAAIRQQVRVRPDAWRIDEVGEQWLAQQQALAGKKGKRLDKVKQHKSRQRQLASPDVF